MWQFPLKSLISIFNLISRRLISDRKDLLAHQNFTLLSRDQASGLAEVTESCETALISRGAHIRMSEILKMMKCRQWSVR